jgi:hypothetical protein
MFLATTIHVRDQCGDFDASRRGGFELRFNISAVESKDGNVDGLFGFFDGGKKGTRPIARLVNELHRQEIQNWIKRTLTLLS